MPGGLGGNQAGFENQVKRVYENFEPSEISAKVAELVKPKCLDGVTEVEIIYQSIENLHEALPDHSGDWYFTGDYPTARWLPRGSQGFSQLLRKQGRAKLLTPFFGCCRREKDKLGCGLRG